MPPVDLIAALYILSDEAEESLSKNPRYFVSSDRGYGRIGSTVQRWHDESKEPAPGETPEPASPPRPTDWLKGPRLELRWDAKRKNPDGFLIGSAVSSCDIAIWDSPRFPGVSAYHGRITFDNQDRLVYRDLRKNSRPGDGSAILYDGRGGNKRRDFTWLLSGTDYLDKKERKIELQLHDRLKLRVYVPPQNCTSAEYAAKVKTFFSLTAEDLEAPESLHQMTIQGRDTTVVPSGTRTVALGPILFRAEVLGGGTYGKVVRLYNPGDGTSIARKLPVGDPSQWSKWRWTSWDREVKILNQVKRFSHLETDFSRHVIRMFTGTVRPPVINLEYAPCGNLWYQHYKRQGLSGYERRVVLEQILKALAFVHKLNITHRDVKANNILVFYRAATTGGIMLEDGEIIHTKLTDFGLSKEGDPTTINLGTGIYRAPELFARPSQPGPAYDPLCAAYTPVVDIWSTGVMIYELDQRALENGTVGGKEMCKWVMETIKKPLQSELAAFVAQYMVRGDPKQRLEARACLKKTQLVLVNPPYVDADTNTSAYEIEYGCGDADQDIDNGADTPRPRSPACGPSQAAAIPPQDDQAAVFLDPGYGLLEDDRIPVTEHLAYYGPDAVPLAPRGEAVQPVDIVSPGEFLDRALHPTGGRPSWMAVVRASSGQGASTPSRGSGGWRDAGVCRVSSEDDHDGGDRQLVPRHPDVDAHLVRHGGSSSSQETVCKRRHATMQSPRRPSHQRGTTRHPSHHGAPSPSSSRRHAPALAPRQRPLQETSKRVIDNQDDDDDDNDNDGNKPRRAARSAKRRRRRSAVPPTAAPRSPTPDANYVLASTALFGDEGDGEGGEGKDAQAVGDASRQDGYEPPPPVNRRMQVYADELGAPGVKRAYGV